MRAFLEFTFWLLTAFTVADYTLGRATVHDPIRVILAVVFALLFVLVVQKGLL